MKTKKSISKILLIAMVAVFTGCSKFEEGGLVKKADENIPGTWTLSQYQRNGVDETDSIQVSNFTETYSENGAFLRSYNHTGGTETEDGTWSINDDNEDIHLSDVSSINNFSTHHSTLSTSAVHVLKLTEDELWYTFDNGGDTHEFHFVK